jgi:ribosomal-protein-alanine N-acetyltransferase
MDESLKSVLEFGFKKLDLDIMEAYTHKNNESSKKLLKRNGFTFVKDKKDEYNQHNIIY